MSLFITTSPFCRQYRRHTENDLKAFVECSACSKPRILSVPSWSASLTKEGERCPIIVEKIIRHAMIKYDNIIIQISTKRLMSLWARKSLPRMQGREIHKRNSFSFAWRNLSSMKRRWGNLIPKIINSFKALWKLQYFVIYFHRVLKSNARPLPRNFFLTILRHRNETPLLFTS